MAIKDYFKNPFKKSNDDERYGLYNSIDRNSIVNWSKKEFLEKSEISLYVNRAIDKRAEKVSQVKFYLKQGDKIIEKNPYIDLLNRPNPYHTGAQFWKLYQKYKDATGSAYIYLEKNTELFAGDEKKIKAMYLLRPDCVEPQVDAHGAITGYLFKNINGTDRTYGVDEIIYSFEPDPMNPLNGVSLLKSGIRAIETELQISEYHSKILKNGGKVEGVFKFKAPNLTQAQIKDLKEKYKEQYAGAKNAGDPLFLGGDAEYVRIGLNPDELSYLEAKNVTLDDICILTGVPKSVLANMSGIKFDNADASIALFLRETIKPQLDNLQALLDWRLIPKEFDLCYTDPTPEDTERKLKEIENGIKNYYLTPNEAREMRGLEPITGGDKLLIPFNLLTIEERPKTEPSAKKTVDVEHPLRDPYIRKKYGELKEKKMTKQETKVLSAIKHYFNEQRDRLLESVDTRKGIKSKGLFDEIFSPTLEVKLARGTLLPLIEEVLKEAGIDALDFIGYSGEFHITSTVSSWLDIRADKFAHDITDTTYEKLKDQFTESFSQGEARQDLVKRIEETYDGFTTSRAETIARTETHAAFSKGTYEGYKQAGLSTKIWVTVGDINVRDSHKEIDGEEVPINQPFKNGLMYPGDPSGSAGEVINCRCQI